MCVAVLPSLLRYQCAGLLQMSYDSYRRRIHCPLTLPSYISLPGKDFYFLRLGLNLSATMKYLDLWVLPFRRDLLNVKGPNWGLMTQCNQDYQMVQLVGLIQAPMRIQKAELVEEVLNRILQSLFLQPANHTHNFVITLFAHGTMPLDLSDIIPTMVPPILAVHVVCTADFHPDLRYRCTFVGNLRIDSHYQAPFDLNPFAPLHIVVESAQWTPTLSLEHMHLFPRQGNPILRSVRDPKRLRQLLTPTPFAWEDELPEIVTHQFDDPRPGTYEVFCRISMHIPGAEATICILVYLATTSAEVCRLFPKKVHMTANGFSKIAMRAWRDHETCRQARIYEGHTIYIMARGRGGAPPHCGFRILSGHVVL